MVQISKLTKAELAITGFKNRSIASRFMKQMLNKKSRDFKDKVELINALTTKYFEMKNYGIDLNDIAKVERNVKQADKFVKKSQEEYNKLLEREDLQQIVSDLEVENYLKEINYKLPENKNYTDVKKKLKNKFYYEWKGIEDIVQTITDLYRQQDTSFKFNISLGYILTNGQYYKYYSPQYNNRLFDYPKTIDNNNSLIVEINNVENEIKKCN